MPKLRVAAVVNVRLRSRARMADRALARLRETTGVVAVLETRGDGSDVRRIVELATDAEPDVLVAVGGDGTAGVALRALLDAKRTEHTALAIVPIGTGNNAARSFGLRPLREGARALAQALAAIAVGPRRPIDVGLLDGSPFLGSVSIGMDADVLASRNRSHRRLEGRAAGYGLYAGMGLASLSTRHGGRARLSLDGACETRTLYSLVVLNAPVYAGPLRFDGENDCADGLLDVHAVASAPEYVAEYAAAWFRYLRSRHGGSPSPSRFLRRAREIEVEFERPIAAQVDGEELVAAASFRIGVLPRAVCICRPPLTGSAARGGSP
jgi:diacylglycerol kinase family enzyme